ncbi:hypothetical protein ACFL6S_07085 [Candidatus Poribacteria bacterium]
MDYRPQTRVYDLNPVSYISHLRSRIYSLKPIVLLWLVILCFCVSSSAMGYMLSVGHLPPLRNGHTVLLITDLGGSGPAVKIRFHDEGGQEVPASPIHKLLPPRGKIQIHVEDYLQTAGTIALESSSDQIVGEYWQINKDGAILTLPFQRPGVEERYFVNCFRFPSCEHDYLVLSDPSGSGPLVQMELYNTAGELIKVAAKKLLRPYSTLALGVDAYASRNRLGKVSVRSFGGSTVIHYRQLCDNDAISATPARSPAKELLIDEFSAGSGITGNLVIVDASAEGPATSIQFRDSDGTVLYELEKLLPPNGVVLIEPADYVNSISRGTISISSESEVIADYWEKDSQAILNIPAVDIEKTSSVLLINHFLPFDDTQNLLSLLNVGQESVKVEVQFYADSGREINIEEFFLEPYKRIDELVGPYLNGASLGTIIVKSPNASLVVSSHIENHRLLGKVHAQVIR